MNVQESARLKKARLDNLSNGGGQIIDLDLSSKTTQMSLVQKGGPGSGRKGHNTAPEPKSKKKSVHSQATDLLGNKDATYKESLAEEKKVSKKLKSMDSRSKGLGLSDKQHKEMASLKEVKRKLNLRNSYSNHEIKNMSNAHYKRTFGPGNSKKPKSKKLKKAHTALGMV